MQRKYIGLEESSNPQLCGYGVSVVGSSSKEVAASSNFTFRAAVPFTCDCHCTGKPLHSLRKTAYFNHAS